MKLKITNIKQFTKSRDEQPLLDKNSRPYTRITIQTVEYPGKWLSGLGYQGEPQLAWRIGDEIEADVVPNGQYLNFRISKLPKTGGMPPDLMEKLFKKLDVIQTSVSKIEKLIGELAPADMNEDQLAEQFPPIEAIGNQPF